MAKLLNDTELKQILGSVIINGDEAGVRPNSYILRLGSQGEFLNTEKEFEIGKVKKGIRLDSGHSVGVTSFETLDFRRSTVHKFFPNCDLHAFLSPTTDLSREGIVAPTTQIDAGYNGTLNWTLANTSSRQRSFVYKEKIYRLSIFKLEEGETPGVLYDGDYQSQTGYVRSCRPGAPTGMKDCEWEEALTEGGPEDILKTLIKSGYPWNMLGKQLKIIDDRFEDVTNEYQQIVNAMTKISGEVEKFSQTDLKGMIRTTLHDEATSLQNRWLVNTGVLLGGIAGVVLTITSNKYAMDALKSPFGTLIGILLVFGAIAFFRFHQNKKQRSEK